MAWENDRIAHRMYGFALNSPAADLVHERLRGSGIDVWGKRVTYPIIDRWYAKGHDQFHKDGEGEGLDLYSIGGSRGAGGTGAWDGSKLWTSDNFMTSQVLSNGPRRAAFKLTYAPVGCGGAGKVQETKTITVDCGVNFDSVASEFDFADDAARSASGIHRASAGRGISQSRADTRSELALDEPVGGEQGRRSRRGRNPGRGHLVRGLRVRTARQDAWLRQPPAGVQDARRRAGQILHRRRLESQRTVHRSRELGKLREGVRGGGGEAA
jgi:hypothetical protein